MSQVVKSHHPVEARSAQRRLEVARIEVCSSAAVRLPSTRRPAAALIDEACRSLERATTIRRCHTAAKKKIDEAAEQFNHLVDDVGIVIGEIKNEIEKS